MPSVEYYTKLAAEKLHKGQDDDAIKNFKEAIKCARKSTDVEATSKCTINLGAALIHVGRTSEGLKVLVHVKLSQRDHLLTGDHWYNLCIAHEELGNIIEAKKCIQQAVKCYSESQHSEAMVLKAGSACRFAFLCAELKEFENAAEAYAMAASSYGSANDVPEQAACLFQQARVLGCCEKSDDAIAVADECIKLCTTQPDAAVGVGQLLNDVGLFYAQCRRDEPEKALHCFEAARRIFQQNSNNRELEATILQNIGAIYNCTANYKDAIEYNRRASEIYAQINCRGRQGQCFSNMAYAYSQVPDFEKADEFYLHALQAAKDTGDRNIEYQALEGRSSIAYQQKKYDRSYDYLTSALTAVSSDSIVHSAAAGERIISKIKGIMKIQLQQDNQHAPQQPLTTAEKSPLLQATDYMIDASSRSSSTKVLATSGHSRGSSSSNSAQPMTAQDMHDTVDELQQEMAKQLSRGGCECLEESGSGTEQGSDDDDDDDDKEEESDSDDTDHEATPASLPRYTAPRAAFSASEDLNRTYLLSADQTKPENKQQVKYSKVSRQDPNYMSIRDHTSNEPPPPSLPPREDETSGESRNAEKLPRSKRQSSKESQACAIM